MKLACENCIIMIMKILAYHGFMKSSLKTLNYNQFIHNKINHREKLKFVRTHKKS